MAEEVEASRDNQEHQEEQKLQTACSSVQGTHNCTFGFSMYVRTYVHTYVPELLQSILYMYSDLNALYFMRGQCTYMHLRCFTNKTTTYIHDASI